MAGDWIKMRVDLQTHPKIVRILSALKADKFRAIGGLHAVWSVFDAHSDDGKLKGYTPEVMDHIIGWIGFSDAMIAVGWMEFDGDQVLVLPEFSEHNGASGKRRADDQKRKRNSRKNPQDVQEVSGSNADKKRTTSGLEKRREENKDNSADAQQLPGLNFDIRSELSARGVDDQVAADWLQMRKSQKAPVTETVLKQHIEEADKARLSLGKALAYAISRNWRGFKAEWYAGAGNGVASGSLSSEQPMKIPKREIVW